MSTHEVRNKDLKAPRKRRRVKAEGERGCHHAMNENQWRSVSAYEIAQTSAVHRSPTLFRPWEQEL